MGQYAHGNQPIQHAIFLQFCSPTLENSKKIRHVMNNLYGADGPDGYCGDEDNGQTSAWFVFSAMGFYPVAPVTMEYVIGSPLFNYVEIELPNNKSVNINVSNNTNENVYISSLCKT